MTIGSSMQTQWGFRVKRLREERGWTQQDLSDKSGLEVSHISKIEKGKYITPTADVIHKLARAVGWTPSEMSAYLYGENDRNRLTLEPVGIMILPIKGYLNAGIHAKDEKLDPIIIPKNLFEGIEDMSGLYCLRVKGNELERSDGIVDGDTVVVKPFERLINNELYVIHKNGDKIARHLRLDGNKVEIRLGNSYQWQEYSEVNIEGRIVFAGHWRKIETSSN